MKNSLFLVFFSLFALLYGCYRNESKGQTLKSENLAFAKRKNPVSINQNIKADFEISLITPSTSNSKQKPIVIRIDSFSGKYKDSIDMDDLTFFRVEIMRSDFEGFYNSHPLSHLKNYSFISKPRKKIHMPYLIEIQLKNIHRNIVQLKPGNYILQAKMFCKSKSVIIYSNEVLLKIVE